MQQIAMVFLAFGMLACSATPREGRPANHVACQVIFDAGSSGTRLYIYQLTASGWVKHSGPQTAALADPVRGISNQTMADAEAVTDSIVAAMAQIQQDGPLQSDGMLKWKGFEWETNCQLETVAVYATAGMRLAERQHPADTESLWEMLNLKLSKALGRSVTTRTLTGFEEGLFAWLATREEQPDANFGIVEMGGASAQISFPCQACTDSRWVLVQGVDVPLVSISFLGLGQDEAWKTHSNPSECSPGIGLRDSAWRVADCTDGVALPAGLGDSIRGFVEQADIHRWHLAGAFLFSKHSDFGDYCQNDIVSAYKPKTSCFRAIYQAYFLSSMGVPISTELSQVDWTLGAAICARDSCLAKAGPPECRWSRGGCVD